MNPRFGQDNFLAPVGQFKQFREMRFGVVDVDKRRIAREFYGMD